MPKGFMSSFARFFGIGKKGESTDMTGTEETGSSATGLSQKVSNHLMNEQLAGLSAGNLQVEQPGDDTVEGTQAKGSIAREDSIEALYNKLKASKRGGFHLLSGNSSFYNKVMDSMNGIMDIMNQEFSPDTRSNLNQFDSIQVEYQKLINACEAYLDRSTLTDKGQIRQEIVKNILQTAQRDLIGLSGVSMEFATLPPEEQDEKNWTDILDEARVTHLSISNLFGGGREKGGKASEVIKITPDMVRIRKEDGTEKPLSGTYYFKPEDEIDVEAITYASKIVNSVIARYPGLSPKEKEILRDWAAEATDPDGATFPEDPQGLSEQGKLALETIKNKTPGVKTTYDSLLVPSKIADEGGKINMTKRNVATNRMAELLGLDNLVAKSYTAELFDEETGQKVRGNMMEQAEGMITYDYRAKRIAAVNERKKREEGKNSTENTENTENTKYKYDVGNIDDVVKNAPSAVSNLVQRDLLNLQVLDVLCGQMDRHMDNIMVKVENSTITGIKGIDNDGAFGLNTDVVAREMHQRHDRRIFDPKSGEMVLPYMDKKLSKRIEELNPQTVRFFLKGLVSDREIEAVLQRLDMMKQGIKHTEAERFLEDNQWNQETAQKIFEVGWKIYNEDTKEKNAKVREVIGRIEPRLKGVKKPDELSDEMKERYNNVKEQAENLIWEETHLRDENYFAKMLITTMVDMKAETIPKIEIR